MNFVLLCSHNFSHLTISNPKEVIYEVSTKDILYFETKNFLPLVTIAVIMQVCRFFVVATINLKIGHLATFFLQDHLAMNLLNIF